MKHAWLNVAVASIMAMASLWPGPVVNAQTSSAEAELAAAGFRAGTHYVELPDTAATPDDAGRIEVAEYFMYSCIHCYNAEPHVEAWLAGKPEDVEFRRVPAIWNPTVELHARTFYAAQALGHLDELHAPLFRSMHVERNFLENTAALGEFVARFGVDGDAFIDAVGSFGVTARVRQASELAERHGVDQTPTFVVNGRYRTTPSMTGGHEALFRLIDLLTEVERQRGIR